MVSGLTCSQYSSQNCVGHSFYGNVGCSSSGEVIRNKVDCVLRILSNAQTRCIDGITLTDVLYNCNIEKGISYCLNDYTYVTYNGGCQIGPNANPAFGVTRNNIRDFCSSDSIKSCAVGTFCGASGSRYPGDSPNGGALCVDYDFFPPSPPIVNTTDQEILKDYSELQESNPVFFRTVLVIFLIIIILAIYFYLKPKNKKKKRR